MRARQVESQRTTRELFAAAIADRAGPRSLFELQALAAAALSVLAVAIDEWAVGDSTQSLADLVDSAFSVLCG